MHRQGSREGAGAVAGYRFSVRLFPGTGSGYSGGGTGCSTVAGMGDGRNTLGGEAYRAIGCMAAGLAFAFLLAVIVVAVVLIVG